jgi:hypothetical protein
MISACDLRLLPVDDPHIFQPAFAQPAARHRRPRTTLTGLRVREIDQPVLGEARVQRDIQETALAARRYRRYSCERCGYPAVLFHDP